MRSTWRALRSGSSPFTPTPIEKKLRERGMSPGARPPAKGLRLRAVVRDAGGLGCEGAKYALLALRGMDASVWVTHHEAGSLQLTERGRDLRASAILSARFRQGEELLITATGPDAHRALEACRVMLEARPEERRGLYRRRYRRESA
jgi:hypothetical protein